MWGLTESQATIILAVIIFALVLIPYALMSFIRSLKNKGKLRECLEDSSKRPRAQHPRVDITRCIGSGSCVIACPEDALGIVNGVAMLTSPEKCVGHGLCAEACPVSAITIVLDPATTAMELPELTKHYETNVPGIFIVGELGGMALIRNAINQGKQVIDYIIEEQAETNSATDAPPPVDYDVVIVGAGPAGLSATVQACLKGMKVLALDREPEVGGAILTYPRQKIVMTMPVDIPGYGMLKKFELTKEELVLMWREIVQNHEPPLRLAETMTDIENHGHYFTVVCSSGAKYTARKVILAMGRNGVPRKLNVPGEERRWVAYRLIDARQYAGKKVLVVGGGDSAVEAAIALSRQHGTSVYLSYRREELTSRVKEKNRKLFYELVSKEKILPYFGSTVRKIEQGKVLLEVDEDQQWLSIDYVLVFIGGTLPTGLLKKIGINFSTMEKTPA